VTFLWQSCVTRTKEFTYRHKSERKATPDAPPPPMSSNGRFDVCVIGGGPVGSATAIAFARRGARVVVLEADTRACRRFAGEWIHPAGVGALDALRAGRLESAHAKAGYGFVIFPGDGTEPIELPYPEGVALSAPHEEIVGNLREVARGIRGVEFLCETQVVEIDGHRVVATKRPSAERLEISADRVVGADGRSSMVRRELGFDEPSETLSHMASIDLSDVELPAEGMGHVFLGGPGPVLAYRISDELVRGCFDIPVAFGSKSRNVAFLWQAFRRVLPESMLDSFRRGLSRPTVRWAKTLFRPRGQFGRGPVALVGDAVGHAHPLTAIGLSNGLLDAKSVADHEDLADYARERRVYPQELLSNALYHCFRRQDASAKSMREATFSALRASERKRRETMDILSGMDRRTSSFGKVCLSVAGGAIRSRVTQAMRDQGLRSIPPALSAFGEWMQWPAAVLVPPFLSDRYRSRSTANHPIPFLKGWIQIGDAGAATPLEYQETTAPLEAGHAPPIRGERGSRRQPGEADRPPAPRVTPARVAEAMTKLTEILIEELEIIAAQIERTPDEVLAVSGLRMVRAITATPMRAGVAARMTIGRRWLARNGIPRLLAAADTHGAFCTTDLARLLLILAGGAGVAGCDAVDLDAGVNRLLALQTASGGFLPRASLVANRDSCEIDSTSLACRALVELRQAKTSLRQSAPELDDAISRARAWLVKTVNPDACAEKTSDLSEVLAAVSAVEALIGTPDGEAKAAAKWLAQATKGLLSLIDASASSGLHFKDPRELVLTSVALRGVVLALGAKPAGSAALSAIDTATWRLSDCVVNATTPLAGAPSERWPRWRIASEVLSTLAAYDAGVRKGAPSSQTSPNRGYEATPTEKDWSYCKKQLALVSRSFSQPIALLPDHLETAVTLAYLLCRVADSVEDHVALPSGERSPLMTLFIEVLHGREDASAFCEAFSDAIGPSAPPTDPELELSTNLTRVMRVFYRLPRITQATLARWVSEMARGMALYAAREPGEDGIIALHTVADLERYCYFVAGTVGHLLTELFMAELGAEATPEVALTLRMNAERFGMGLQLVNILKDLTDDQERRWSYVPRTLCAARSISLKELADPTKRSAARAAVGPLFDIAHKCLDDGMNYALAIPKGHPGIRRFCLLPLWMAARTLVLAQAADAMFTPGEPVKITRNEVAALAAACVARTDDDEFLRAKYIELWSETASEEQRSAS
jgi:phytoene/squalene synthetase/2-polyprenyl-6-methoxyphenol hydroxylase-like FAD-dependent oxidoreductase